jgi:hypothetical protein
MSEREKLVERLVTEMHLSVPERAALSSKAVRYSEVGAVIKRILNETGYFPSNARPSEDRRWRMQTHLAKPESLQVF